MEFKFIIKRMFYDCIINGFFNVRYFELGILLSSDKELPGQPTQIQE